MAVKSARDYEHANGQGLDIARKGTVPKRGGPSPIHPGMANRTNTTIGAPPDASSPKVTDPSRQGKSFAVPAVAHGMKSDPLRGRFDPAFAEAIMSEASRAPDDYARDLHTTLPSAVSED